MASPDWRQRNDALNPFNVDAATHVPVERAIAFSEDLW